MMSRALALRPSDGPPLGREIGRGRRCVVYEWQDVYAVKVVPRAVATAAVLQEKRLLLDGHGLLPPHAHVVRLLATDNDDENLYLVYELLSGGDVFAVLRDERPCCDVGVRRIARQVALALRHCHEHGVVHRDVKLTNVALSARGDAKLIDFGLAVTADECGEDAKRDVVGTRHCLAPEALVDGLYSAASDWYAFGVFVWELWRDGHVLFDRDAWDVPDDAPPALRALLEQLLHRDPTRRTASDILDNEWLCDKMDARVPNAALKK